MALVNTWVVKISGEALFIHSRFLHLKVALLIGISSMHLINAQNCDVDFPGSSQLNYSTECGGGSVNNLTIGKSIAISTGDQFTFDSPAVINIQGNLGVNASGNGRLVIPAGVSVFVDGHMRFDPNNGGCEGDNPCTFTVVVNGHLRVLGGLKNNLTTLVWEGLGTVESVGKLENSSNACMSCGITCPDFPVSSEGCTDNGSRCLFNFCDANYGNACSQDITKPRIENCPVDISLTASVNCTAVATWVPPVASDNCKVTSFEGTHTPGEEFPLGLTLVSYTATDSSGNTASCSFQVEVVDNTVPQFSNCPADIIIPGTDPGSDLATVSWTEPTATDNCKVSQVLSSHQPGSKFPIGFTTVSYSATDDAGNLQTCDFSIEVVSNSPPGAPDLQVSVNSGESIRICIDASDPDGDQVSLVNIDYDDGSGVVDQVDSIQNCFDFIPVAGSEGLVILTVSICDDKDPAACTQVNVEVQVVNDLIIIHKAFSPNGDGINDTWVIGNIEHYSENSVVIFDRWGSIVYEASGYNNQDIVWNGKGNHRRLSSREIVPPGTYYYNITLRGFGSERGFLELLD